MRTTKRWTMEILLDEQTPGGTRAAARLDTSDDAHLHGLGTWNGPVDAADPDDPDDAVVPSVGEELAVATALRQIAAKLSVRAIGDDQGR